MSAESLIRVSKFSWKNSNYFENINNIWLEFHEMEKNGIPSLPLSLKRLEGQRLNVFIGDQKGRLGRNG